MNAIRTLTAIFCLFLSLGIAQAQSRDLQFRSDSADYDEATKRIRLSGNVVITTDGATLSSPYAEYDTAREYAEFLGGVRLEGDRSTATGREMRVWYAETRARFDGNVRLTTRQVGGSEPTVVTAASLDYNWSTEEGNASGGVLVVQGRRKVYADKAEIHQRRNEIVLLGSVRVENGDGSWLTARRAIYDTAKQTVRAEGGVVAKTRLQDLRDDNEEPPARAELPEPTLVEPSFELIPLRRLPSVPLPWLDEQ